MSFNETAITNGVSISGSISPFNTYIKTENAGIYNLQFSAQVEKTDSGTDEIDIWLRKNGIDLIDTATKITLTNNNTKVVAAWNWFVQSATNDYYQIIWSSADTGMRLFAEASSSAHPGIPSVIATANRVDQFLSNTGSFNGDFNGSFTGSLQGTASFATSASFASNATSSSFATTSLTSSFANNFTVAGTLTAQTLNVQTITSSVIYSSGSNVFGNSLSNTQVLTGSVSITGSLAVNGTTATLGTGTINTVPKFTSTNIIGNSNITDNGTLITLNTGSYVNGNLGVGTTPNSAVNLIVEKNITGATLAYGIFSGGTIQSGVTNAARLIQTNAQTAAASFTISNIFHYFANQATFGLGSTVNAQTGFFVESTLTGAVNNYGFRGLIPSGTNRWNIYMDGTADNYLAGALGIGSTSLTGYSLRVSKSITGATTAFVIRQDGIVQSDVTSDVIGFRNDSNTAAAAFTLTNYTHFWARQGTIGLGSAITNQYGYRVDSNMTGATNDFGFYGDLAAASNIWNLYMNGTAANYLNGSLGIGSTSIGAKLQVNNAATVGTGASAMSAINPIIFVDNGNTANGSIVIKAHSVGAGNVVGALRFASSPDGVNYNWAGIEALSAASATVETLVFKISPSNSSAATSTEIMRIDANGLTIGTQTSVAGTELTIGGSYGRGAYLNGVIPSTVTSTARYINTVAQTAAASFTLTNLQHYFAEQVTFGAGSIVTNQFGFYVENNLTGATNNYGFYGNLATSGSRNWNLYMNGTAPNYLAGQLGIGKLPSTGTQLDVLGATILSGSLTVFTGSGIEFQVTNTGVRIGNAITDTHTVTGSINISGSITATNFTGSLFGTSSFAVTSSFVTASNVFGPFGSNSVISASFAVSASHAPNALTASFAISASQAISSSYATFALSASNAPGFTTNFSQSTAATTWSFNHNLNTRNPLVQVYSPTFAQIIPNEIVGIDAFTVEVRFDYAQAGYAVASNGGGLYVTGSTPRLVQTVAATTWSFQHNLGTKYPGYEVYDSNDNVIVPAGIRSVNINNAEIYFAFPTTGVAIANFSGISGSLDNAISSSYAATASYADTFTIDQTLIDYATVVSSINGSNTIFTQATGSYTSAFFKYTITSASNARSGEVISVWNGTSVRFTDTSTTDIGTTSAATSSVVISGGNVLFNVQTNTAGWRIKSLGTYL
jgi:hypothetical protein